MNRRIWVFLPLLLIMVPFVSAGITYQPDILHEIAFNYDLDNYWYVLQWKTWYIKIQPYAVYDGQTYTLKQMVPFIRNQYPAITYHQVVEKFAKYHRWGFWLEKLPPEISNKLDTVGYKLIDTNIPLSAFEFEHDPEMNVSRLSIGGKFTLDFSDLEARYDVSMDKQGIHVTGITGLTDIDMDPITYSAPTITVTGTNGGLPWTFLDIYNADVAGGWGVVSNNNGTDYQFEFNAKIVIGDGIMATTFTDTNKQIVFRNILTLSGQYFIEVKNGATFTLGVLDDLATRTVSQGCSIWSMDDTENIYLIGESHANANAYLYDCNIGALSWARLYRITRIWGAILSNYMELSNNIDSDSLYDLSISKAIIAIYNPLIGCEMDKIIIHSADYGFYSSGVTSHIIRNVEFYGATIFLRGHNINSWNYVVDCSAPEPWTVSWGTFISGGFIRQNTWNTLIKDNTGLPIQNANVTLYRADGTPAFTALTLADGTIAEQIVIRGYYTKVTGNTLQDYGPFTLQVEATDYLPHSIFNIILSEPIDWEIAMSTIEIQTGNIALNSLTAITVIFTLCLMYLLYKNTGGSWRVYLEVFCFVLWFATADLTLTVYPEHGIVNALIYGAFSILSAVFAFFDTIRIMTEEEKWF